MSSRPPAKRTHLLYGNQPYLIDQRASQLTEAVLGAADRDFTYSRFDAEEMLRPGGGDGSAALVEGFQIACESVPFLNDRYVVRLDRVERVRLPSRGAQTLTKRLDSLQVCPMVWEGQRVWVLERQQPDAADAPVSVSQWVDNVATGSDGGTVVTLGSREAPRFLITSGNAGQVVDLKAFLEQNLTGKFSFADDPASSSNSSGGTAPTSLGATLHRLLSRVIENPPPGCWLVLTASGSRESDLSKPLASHVRKHGVIEKFVTYDDYQPLDWLKQEAQIRGMRLDRAAAELLVNLVGNDHGRLAQELDKLGLLLPDGATVDSDLLLRVVHAEHHGSLFLLGERLSQRNLSGALDLLGRFLEQNAGEFPLLIGVLARYFRQLGEIHAYSAQGISGGDLAGRLKLHPFIAKRVVAQAAKFARAEVAAIQRALAKLDVALRTGSRITEVLVQDFLQSVCAGGFAERPLGARGSQQRGVSRESGGRSMVP